MNTERVIYMTHPESRQTATPEVSVYENVSARSFLESLHGEPIQEEPANFPEYLQGCDFEEQRKRAGYVRGQVEDVLSYDENGLPASVYGTLEDPLAFVLCDRTLYGHILIHDHEGGLAYMEDVIDADERTQSFIEKQRRFKGKREDVVEAAKATRVLVVAELFMRELDLYHRDEETSNA